MKTLHGHDRIVTCTVDLFENDISTKSLALSVLITLSLLDERGVVTRKGGAEKRDRNSV